MTRNFVIPFFLTALFLGVCNDRSLAQDSAAKAAPPAAQVPVKVADPSLNGQYRDMLMRSRTQEGYKVVNPYRLTTLWNNTMDTLNTERRKRLEAERKLASGLKEMNAMRDSLSKSEEILGQSQTQADQISLLGIPVNKTTYNSVMWGTVIILALALLVSLFQASRYRKEAAYRIKLFEELSGEFQSYKTKANEREKKLARELQDERNKLEELTKRD